ADLVFREWGLAKGSDVGRIVFQLVESGQLSAREEDTMEDFLRAPDPIEALGMTGGDAEHRAGQHGRSGGGAPAPG
ncbi:MAG: hypothetical protein HYR73_06925, partial [Candidatus Eisenbacteria bacterium]|nr:hypothetical protein [Candidatus Eisenbacteria bacterium]